MKWAVPHQFVSSLSAVFQQSLRSLSAVSQQSLSSISVVLSQLYLISFSPYSQKQGSNHDPCTNISLPDKCRWWPKESKCMYLFQFSLPGRYPKIGGRIIHLPAYRSILIEISCLHTYPFMESFVYLCFLAPFAFEFRHKTMSKLPKNSSTGVHHWLVILAKVDYIILYYVKYSFYVVNGN